MTKRRRQSRSRRIRSRRTHKPVSYLCTNRIVPWPDGSEPPGELVNALVYIIGVYQRGVSLHGCSFSGSTYRIFFTAKKSVATRFRDSVAGEMANLLNAYRGTDDCRVEHVSLVPVSDPGEAISVLVEFADAEQQGRGLSAFGPEDEDGSWRIVAMSESG